MFCSAVLTHLVRAMGNVVVEGGYTVMVSAAFWQGLTFGEADFCGWGWGGRSPILVRRTRTEQ